MSFSLSAFTLDAADEDIGKENIKNNTTEANTTDIIVLHRSEDKHKRMIGLSDPKIRLESRCSQPEDMNKEKM